jgi:hypothetical protein
MSGTEPLSHSQAPVAALLLLNSYSLYLCAVRIALKHHSGFIFDLTYGDARPYFAAATYTESN